MLFQNVISGVDFASGYKREISQCSHNKYSQLLVFANNKVTYLEKKWKDWSSEDEYCGLAGQLGLKMLKRLFERGSQRSKYCDDQKVAMSRARG